MNKISCDTCLDLMPLVKDKVASQDSKDLVKDHLKSCETCEKIYENFNNEAIAMDESNIISKIKKQLFIVSIIFIVIASMLGLALSESMDMFYNILIMPAIGVIGYFALDKKSYYVPMSLFFFSYIWLFIKYIGEGMLREGMIIGVFFTPIYWSAIYAGLCMIGLIIGFLLKYAFGKEKRYED